MDHGCTTYHKLAYRIRLVCKLLVPNIVRFAEMLEKELVHDTRDIVAY